MLWDYICVITVLTYTLHSHKLPGFEGGMMQQLLLVFLPKDLLTFCSRAGTETPTLCLTLPVDAEAETTKHHEAFSTLVCSTAQLRCLWCRGTCTNDAAVRESRVHGEGAGQELFMPGLKMIRWTWAACRAQLNTKENNLLIQFRAWGKVWAQAQQEHEHVQQRRGHVTPPAIHQHFRGQPKEEAALKVASSVSLSGWYLAGLSHCSTAT